MQISFFLHELMRQCVSNPTKFVKSIVQNNMWMWYKLRGHNYKRSTKHAFQRLTRGWSDDELWSLDHSLAKLIAPRLKAYRKQTCGCPSHVCSKEEWNKILDKMIEAFEFIASEEYWNASLCDRDNIVEEGLALFAEHFCALWW